MDKNVYRVTIFGLDFEFIIVCSIKRIRYYKLESSYLEKEENPVGYCTTHGLPYMPLTDTAIEITKQEYLKGIEQ